MLASMTVLAAAAVVGWGAPAGGDTLRIEVGSPLVNGRVYAPHAARVRVRIGSDSAPLIAEWVNELTLGDSAGRQVMRLVTRGKRSSPNGDTVRTELFQTYDAVTLAPYGYLMRSSLTIEAGGAETVRFSMSAPEGTREAELLNSAAERPGRSLTK